MVEGNNDFLAGDHALGHLAGPMHKKYSMTFIWSHPFNTCESYDQFFGPSHILPCMPFAFRVPLHFAYVISSI